MSNEEYILAHRQDDVRRLALTKAPEGIDLRWCLQQIEGWQLARHKLPRWAETEGLWFPPRISLEQCSSEQTAQYKRQVAERITTEEERTAMADLTGGLGVDFSYLAPLFREATYIELQPHLRELAAHNLPLLGQPNASIASPTQPITLPPSSTAEAAKPVTLPFSLLFLDPSRRDNIGRKTVSIADCTPNVVEIQDELLSHAQWVMIKLSPMLDIHEALRQLHGVREIHVVSVRGECKELVFVMQNKENGNKDISIHCVNLGTDEETITSPYPLPRRELEPLENYLISPKRHEPLERNYNKNTDGQVMSPLWEGIGGGFLYEPNASILKASIQDVLCERYPVRKLHPMSHLFIGDTLIPHFPGRRFQITGWSNFSKKALKNLVGDLSKANLTVRNFPTDVAILRRQLRLAEGGDTYLFATTLAGGQRVLIRTRRAEV